MSNKTIKFETDLYTLANFLAENLSEEDMVELVKEFDNSCGSWDFVHKVYTYLRKIIQEDKEDYQQFLEDQRFSDKEMTGPTIERIMDELEG